jgi:hypothetical protein
MAHEADERGGKRHSKHARIPSVATDSSVKGNPYSIRPAERIVLQAPTAKVAKKPRCASLEMGKPLHLTDPSHSPFQNRR